MIAAVDRQSPTPMKSLLTPGICLVAVVALLHTGLLTPSAALISSSVAGRRSRMACATDSEFDVE